MKRVFFALIALAALAFAGCEAYSVAKSEGYYDMANPTDVGSGPDDPDTMIDVSPANY